MWKQRRLWQLVVLVSWCLEARGADKYTDENRPYEFGFNIEGEQHRHEKKDENGLIMGEFGFITADGVYHVTVYATDENGNFKILSMKNLRVKPFPSAVTPQSRAIDFPPSSSKSGQPIAQSPAPVPSPSKELPPLPQPSPVRSCSSCSIPTSTTQAPKQLTDLAVVSVANEQFPPYPEQPLNTRGRQFVPEQNQGSNSIFPPLYTNEPSQPGFPPNNQFDSGINQPVPGQISQQPGQFGQQPDQYGQQPGQFGHQPGQFEQQTGQFGQQPSYPQSGEQQPPQPDISINARFGQDGQGQSPNYQSGSPGVSTKPTLISAQMRVVDSNTDIHQRGPGEQEGLPNGINKDDMLQLLYTFNYTVGFHGHHEEGYTNGVKKGYYYVTGRNGVRTRVDYVADSEGFHPKISNEVLDLLSDDVPKPETEKNDEYGLKGYEFKWLYYPPTSRR